MRIRFRAFVLFLAAIPLTGFGQTNSQTFSFGDKGAASIISDGNGSLTVGYGRVVPDAGKTAPSGVAIFTERNGAGLISEAGVPASPLIQQGRIYAEVGPNGFTGSGIDIGLAIANPGPTPATIRFKYTRSSDGTDIGSGSYLLGAGSQIASYLDQGPWNLPLNFQGTFTFTSNTPISVIALQLFNNERREALITTLPVIDTTAGANSTPALLSHFVDGVGFSTTVILVNQTETPQAGTIVFRDDFGNFVTLTANSTTAASFPYSIPAHSSFKLQTAGGANVQVGSVTVTPSAGNNTPVSLSVFSQSNGVATVTQAGVPSNLGTDFRTYVEATSNQGAIGSYATGFAIANASTLPGSVTFNLYTATGAATGLSTTIPLTALGHKAEFITELFPTLTLPFQGLLRISTSLPAISVVSLRIRINERGDHIETTTPPSNEDSAAGTAEVDFPQIANGAGWTTQFNLFSGVTNQATSGTLTFVQPDSTPFPLSTINLIAGPPVTLTSIAPSTAPVGGQVVLTGTNMSSSDVVIFSTNLGALGVSPSAATSTSLTATVPSNAITGPVFVLNGSQQSAAVILQVTASNGSPQITTFSVVGGANTAGTDIYVPPPAGSLSFTEIGILVNGAGNAYTASATLSKGSSKTMAFVGTGFTPSTSVSAGAGVTVSGVSFVNSTTITATVTVSAGAGSGPRSITVVNPNGDVAIFTGGLTIQ